MHSVVNDAFVSNSATASNTEVAGGGSDVKVSFSLEAAGAGSSSAFSPRRQSMPSARLTSEAGAGLKRRVSFAVDRADAFPGDGDGHDGLSPRRANPRATPATATAHVRAATAQVRPTRKPSRVQPAFPQSPHGGVRVP